MMEHYTESDITRVSSQIKSIEMQTLYYERYIIQSDYQLLRKGKFRNYLEDNTSMDLDKIRASTTLTPKKQTSCPEEDLGKPSLTVYPDATPLFLKAALLAVVLVGVCSERRHGPVLERQLLYMDVEPKVSEIKEFLDVSENYKQLPTFLVTILTGLLSILGPILNTLFGGLLTPLLVGLSSALGVASSGTRIQTPAVISTSDSTSLPARSPWTIDTSLGHVYSVEENGLTKTEKDISYDGPVIPDQSGYKTLPQQENYYSGTNPHIPVSYAPSYVPLLMASLNGVSAKPWLYHQSSRRYIPAEPTPLAAHIGTVSSSHFSQTEAMKGQSEPIRKLMTNIVQQTYTAINGARTWPVYERWNAFIFLHPI
ncbi:unnamed protein product [Timema podura]|uniref:Uncharacterized protein n=1 Tax=Timema podura TaxID=61482 RepID=A0ABN7NT65_TIMPD|nr:unnamed protein product [Timema podura]